MQRVDDEVFTRKNLSVLAETFDANLVIHDFQEAALPIDELIIGVPDLQVTVDHLVAEGDLVAAMMTFTGTQQAEFLGVAPTGNPVTWTHIDRFRIQHVKIADVWHNVPRADILKQLSEPPASSLIRRVGSGSLRPACHRSSCQPYR